MEHIIKQFDAIGARLLVRPMRRPRTVFQTARLRVNPRTFDLNIGRDRDGEHFVLATSPDTPDLRVLQANRANRHLLLHAAGEEGGERFLCGHDERHWFVAGVTARVSTVTEAKRALLPRGLREAGLTPDQLARRKTEAFVRQGEWFFLPTSRNLSKGVIHHMEPLQRGRGKPHYVSDLIRFGGTEVVLFHGHEYTPEEAAQIPGAASGRRVMKDPEVYVRGRVWHPDHATIVLDGWHRAVPNTEARSANVSFYD